MGLRQRFMQAAQLVKDDNEGRESEGNTFDDDLESAKGMARLFAEAGEAHAPAIVAGCACSDIRPTIDDCTAWGASVTDVH